MSNPWLIAALLTCLASASAAPAQYRSDMPLVLTPPAAARPTAADSVAIAAFRAAYASAGRPRVALLWNRELTDRVATQYDDVVHVERHAGSAGVAEVSRDGRAVGRVDRADSVATLRAGVREVDPERLRSSVVKESTEWALKAAFLSRLQEAGVRLVDRNVAMRGRAAASPASARADRQTFEMEALADKADLVMDVLQTPDPDTPLGATVRVETKSVATGAILVNLADGGASATPQRGRFVAGANGFVHEAPKAPTASEVGEILANRLLNALTAYWNTHP